MKEILILLLVLIFCAPAMAATITVVDNETTPPTVTITVATEAGEPNIVGVALDVDLDQGTVTSAVVSDPAFNIYPDAAYTEELGDSYAYGEGTPVCAQDARGEISLPQSSFALSFGNLNGAAVAGADGASSVQITLTLDEMSGLTICENDLRGGIVAVDSTLLDVDCLIAEPPVCRGDTNLDGKISVADMAEIIEFVSPYPNTTPPYCYYPPFPEGKEQCDVNGDGRISVADMAEIIAFLSPDYANTTPPYTYIGCMPPLVE